MCSASIPAISCLPVTHPHSDICNELTVEAAPPVLSVWTQRTTAFFPHAELRYSRPKMLCNTYFIFHSNKWSMSRRQNLVQHQAVNKNMIIISKYSISTSLMHWEIKLSACVHLCNSTVEVSQGSQTMSTALGWNTFSASVSLQTAPAGETAFYPASWCEATQKGQRLWRGPAQARLSICSLFFSFFAPQPVPLIAPEVVSFPNDRARRENKRNRHFFPTSRRRSIQVYWSRQVTCEKRFRRGGVLQFHSDLQTILKKGWMVSKWQTSTINTLYF